MVADQLAEPRSLEADDHALAAARDLEVLDQLPELAGEPVDGTEGQPGVMRRAGDARELDAPIDPIEGALERLGVLPGRWQAARDTPGVLELDAGVVGAIVALMAAFDDVVALVQDQQRAAGDVRPEVAAGDERGPEVAALRMAPVGELAQRLGERRGF